MAGIPVSSRDLNPSLLGATHARRGALREKCRSGPCALLLGNSPGSPDGRIGVLGMLRSQTHSGSVGPLAAPWGVLPRGTHMTPCATAFRGEPGQARAQPAYRQTPPNFYN